MLQDRCSLSGSCRGIAQTSQHLLNLWSQKESKTELNQALQVMLIIVQAGHLRANSDSLVTTNTRVHALQIYM